VWHVAREPSLRGVTMWLGRGGILYLPLPSPAVLTPYLP